MLQLRKNQGDAQHRFGFCDGCIKLIPKGNEVHVVALKRHHQGFKIQQLTRKPIQLFDDNRIDFAGLDVSHQFLVLRSVGVAAGFAPFDVCLMNTKSTVVAVFSKLGFLFFQGFPFGLLGG